MMGSKQQDWTDAPLQLPRASHGDSAPSHADLATINLVEHSLADEGALVFITGRRQPVTAPAPLHGMRQHLRLQLVLRGRARRARATTGKSPAARRGFVLIRHRATLKTRDSERSIRGEPL